MVSGSDGNKLDPHKSKFGNVGVSVVSKFGFLKSEFFWRSVGSECVERRWRSVAERCGGFGWVVGGVVLGLGKDEADWTVDEGWGGGWDMEDARGTVESENRVT